MTSGMYDENLVAHVESFDGDVLFAEARLISQNAGPAGHISLALSDGIEIEVDYVDPGLMTVISVEESAFAYPDRRGGGPDTALLDELIGDDRAQMVTQALAEGRTSPVRIESSNESLRMTTAPTRGSRVTRAFGQAAGLLDIAADHRETVAVRAIAAIEAARYARDLQAPLVLRAVITRVEDVLVSLDDEDARTLDDLGSLRDDLRELAETDPKITFMVLDLIRDVVPRLTGPAAGIAEYIVRALEGHAHIDEHDDLNVVVDRWRADRPISDRPISMAMLTTTFEPAHYEKSMAMPPSGPIRGRWITTWDEYPGGSWVRILDPDDQLLVALVPVREVKTKWCAEAIVPTTRLIEEWIIEVTDTPLPPKKITSSERIVEAVRLGRLATRLSAKGAGRDRAVEGAWLACAEAWKEAGDPAREARARQYAIRPAVQRPVFLTDHLREALGLTPP